MERQDKQLDLESHRGRVGKRDREPPPDVSPQPRPRSIFSTADAYNEYMIDRRARKERLREFLRPPRDRSQRSRPARVREQAERREAAAAEVATAEAAAAEAAAAEGQPPPRQPPPRQPPTTQSPPTQHHKK